MVDRAITDIAKRYASLLRAENIPVSRVVLFGSFAEGKGHQWSDIDLLVVLDDGLAETEFDRLSTRLWSLARKIDSRIEPLAISEDEWLHDERTPIVSIIREKGIDLAA